MAEGEATVRLDRPGPGIARVTICRPGVRNALDVAAVAALGGTLARLDGEPGLRAIVLAGEEGHLSAGSDIKEMARRGLACLRDPARMAGWAQIEALRCPLLAAVDGLALGAGLELALLADVILAGPAARFGLPELKLGVLPGDGGTQRLSRRIGPGRALRLILTGDIIDQAEAVRIGLAEPAPGGAMAGALDMAGRIAANAPAAARLAKEVVKLGLEAPLAAALALEARALERLFGAAEQIEGMAAFLAKRPPSFTGA